MFVVMTEEEEEHQEQPLNVFVRRPSKVYAVTEHENSKLSQFRGRHLDKNVSSYSGNPDVFSHCARCIKRE
jgi:hypothetical protein